MKHFCLFSMWIFIVLCSYLKVAHVTLGLPSFLVWFHKLFFFQAVHFLELFAAHPVSVFTAVRAVTPGSPPVSLRAPGSSALLAIWLCSERQQLQTPGGGCLIRLKVAAIVRWSGEADQLYVASVQAVGVRPWQKPQILAPSFPSCGSWHLFPPENGKWACFAFSCKSDLEVKIYF